MMFLKVHVWGRFYSFSLSMTRLTRQKEVKANVYADDTSLTHSDVKFDSVAQVINSELEKVKEWLQGNKLSLYINKTISMIIGTTRMLTDENGENLLHNFTLDGRLIQQKMQLNI